VKPDCQNCKNKNCFVLNYFPPEKVSEISVKKSFSQHKNGNYIYRKNSNPQSVYILYEGCLEVIKKDANGGKKDFYFVEPGELFGYRSLLCEEPHNTSAKVYQNSRICEISKEDFYELFIKNEGLAVSFMKFLSDQLTRQEKKLENKTTQN